MRSGEAARQAAADEEVLERIEAQILERYQQYCPLVDCPEEEGPSTVRHHKDVLKGVIADVLQRHVAAAVDEITNAMTDEVEALAQDRVADLRARLESGDEP